MKNDWLCHFNFQCKDNEHGFCTKHKTKEDVLKAEEECLYAKYLRSLGAI